MKLKIAFDIGGVISKYPAIVRQLMLALQEQHEVYVLTDQHDRESVMRQLTENGFGFIPPERVFCADYDTYGERCKAVICEREGFDVLMDDFPGYLAGDGGAALRLLVQPDPYRPYYAPEWRGTPDEGKFGRRVAPSRAAQTRACIVLSELERAILLSLEQRDGQNLLAAGHTREAEVAVERLVRFRLISEWITEDGQRRPASDCHHDPEDRIEYSLTDEGRAVLAACERQN